MRGVNYVSDVVLLGYGEGLRSRDESGNSIEVTKYFPEIL